MTTDLPIFPPPVGIYPTADAYEAARAALEKHRKRADDAEAEVARLRRELAWQTGSDGFCHVVRGGDETPCTAPPGDLHVDADGREWGFLNDYADEPTEGCA